MPLSIKPFLISFILLALCSSAFAQQSYQFIFGEVVTLSNSTKTPNSELLYSIEFIKGSARTVSTATASELMPIVKFMGLERPKDLVGKSFSSHLSDPFDALDYLRMQALHNGNYTPPTSDQFFDQLAKGLVDSENGECPQTKDIADSHTVYLSMHAAFPNGCNAIDPNFQTKLNSRIEKFSSGRMSIVVASSKELNGFAVMCDAEYFLLKLGNRPIAKFMLTDAVNGFACTKSWESDVIPQFSPPVFFSNNSP